MQWFTRSANLTVAVPRRVSLRKKPLENEKFMKMEYRKIRDNYCSGVGAAPRPISYSHLHNQCKLNVTL